MTYKAPITARIFRVLGLIAFTLSGAGLVVSIFEGRGDAAMWVGILCGLFIHGCGVWLDYTARAAFHAERTANSLERMEWNAGAAQREAEQRAHAARAQAQADTQRQVWEAAQRTAQGES